MGGSCVFTRLNSLLPSDAGVWLLRPVTSGALPIFLLLLVTIKIFQERLSADQKFQLRQALYGESGCYVQ